MQDWRATRPVDVARLNSSIFLAVLRKLAAACLICAPVYFGAIILLAELRAPQLSIGFVLGHVWLYFVTAFVAHLAFGLAFSTFSIAVGSLIWWRHILATGGPSTFLTALASVLRRVVLRLAHRVNDGRLALLVRRERTTPAVPDDTLLAQLLVALVVAPDGQPPRLAHLADPMVRIDQLTLRRSA